MFHVAVSRAQYLVAAKATYTWDIFNVSTNMAPGGGLLEFGKVVISENGQVSHHSTRTQKG